jgi:serine/threonine protein kinase
MADACSPQATIDPNWFKFQLASLRVAGEGLDPAFLAEMRERWKSGERPLAEEFLARQPSLLHQPEAALELIYEEICLRDERGEQPAADDLVRRFPQWEPQLRLLLECHQKVELPCHSPRFPNPGETIGEFKVLVRLGGGAQGSAYLATQPSLADRPVVLKATPSDDHEHLSLARLQHTHVVPLYAAHQDASRNLRVLCMPYFGSATLSRVLHAVEATPLAQRDGRQLVDALDRAQSEMPIKLPARGPARDLLARATYTQAICWIGACLADALQYAHERGLVHLDLKPSNVLLAADGQPMLLDFHLAQPPIRPGGESPRWIGGTLPFMSREQQAALTAVRERRPVTLAVDARADIYSLGAMLYQALGGALPILPGVSPPLDALNPDVSLGLSDIIAKCVAEDARDRYPDAASLAADLHRHLANQPLQGVPNRSLIERLCKWRRRQPYRVAAALMLLAVTGAGVALGLGQWEQSRQRTILGHAALQGGREQIQRGHPEEAVATLRHGLMLAEPAWFQGSLAADLREELSRAEAAVQEWQRSQAAEELHALADQMRFLYGSELPPLAEARRLEEQCRNLWDRRQLILEHCQSNRPTVKTDLLDLAILWIDLRARLAPGPARSEVHRQALGILEQAEKLFGSSHILYREKQRQAEALGHLQEAREAARLAQANPPRTAWEHYALGLALLRTPESLPWPAALPGPAFNLGLSPIWSLRLIAAAKELEQAAALDPHSLWPSYYHGLCSYRCGSYHDAVADFSRCIGAAPDKAAFYFNRALAHAALGEPDRAWSDFLGARQIEKGRSLSAAPVHFNLAVASITRGDRDGAQNHVHSALEDDPNYAPAQALKKSLSR